MKGIDIAKTKLGLQEVRDRKTLMDFFKKNSIEDDILVDPSVTPWCAVFLNACERESGFKGTGLENARSFLNYGQEVSDQDKAQEGDIIIFARGHSTTLGHVSYFIKWEDDKDTVLILGGNQGDKVCYESHTQEGILGIRRSI